MWCVESQGPRSSWSARVARAHTPLLVVSLVRRLLRGMIGWQQPGVLLSDQGAGVSNLRLTGCTRLRMAVSAAQHKTVTLLKTLRDCFCVIVCCSVFNVWPKTTLLLPMWPRDAKRLDTPEDD